MTMSYFPLLYIILEDIDLIWMFGQFKSITILVIEILKGFGTQEK